MQNHLLSAGYTSWGTGAVHLTSQYENQCLPSATLVPVF